MDSFKCEKEDAEGVNDEVEVEIPTEARKHDARLHLIVIALFSTLSNPRVCLR